MADESKNNFFSMDRLVEFGMGMAMSQQIAKSMNDMMASMQTPPKVQQAAVPIYTQNTIDSSEPKTPVYQKTAQAVQSTTSEVFYVSLESGKSSGPYSGTEIARLVLEKKVTAETPVWKNGMKDWAAAKDFPDLVALIALVPPNIKDSNMEN